MVIDFLLTVSNDRTQEVVEAAETAVKSSDSSPLKLAILGILIIVCGSIMATVLYIIRKAREEDEDEYDNETGDDEDIKTVSPSESGMKTVKIFNTYAGCPYHVGSVHDIGRREMQQDSFGVSDLEDPEALKEKGFLAVVADGMGGLSDGERMSQLVVVNMLQGFEEASASDPSPSVLMGLLDRATKEVNNDLGPEKLGKCGSTVVATIIKNNLLSYISVGDSHIYVWREGRLIKINKDHNYAAELDELVSRGEMSAEEAMNDPQRAALTSFIGMGKLEMVDQNITPFELHKGDRILLMSDGIYGTLGDERITGLMNEPLKQSCLLMDNEIRTINRKSQDNYTCVIIEIE